MGIRQTAFFDEDGSDPGIAGESDAACKIIPTTLPIPGALPIARKISLGTDEAILIISEMWDLLVDSEAEIVSRLKPACSWAKANAHFSI